MNVVKIENRGRSILSHYKDLLDGIPETGHKKKDKELGRTIWLQIGLEPKAQSS
jgi:hypothetical protein